MLLIKNCGFWLVFGLRKPVHMQLPSYLHRKQCSVLLVLTGIFHLIGSYLMRCQAPFSEAWRILEELDLLPLALSSKTNNGQKHSRKSVTATS